MATKQKGAVTWIGTAKKGPDSGKPAFFLKGVEGIFTVPDHKVDKVKKGDEIEFEAAKLKGGGFRVKSQPKVLSSGGGGRYGGKGGGKNYDAVDYNAAVARAIEATRLLLDHGGLKVSKTKVAENEVIILEKIDELTAKYFEGTKNRHALKKAKEADDELDEEESDEEESDEEDESSEEEEDPDDPFED